jgi:outer membrane lipoprotein-sorting protein
MKPIVAALGLLILGASAWAIDAVEIVRRLEANQVHGTAVYEGNFSITDRFGTRMKSFKASVSGTDKTLIEFTNPEEKGQKILRIGDDVRLYVPEAEEVIRLQGSALKDSVLGSDFSYEDLTGEKGLLDLYSVEAEGTAEVDGRSCHVLKMTAKKKDIAYPVQRAWVDAELFVLRKAEYYSLSGKPIKDLAAEDVRKVSGKNIPFRMRMRDLMKKDSSTVFQLVKIAVDAPLDPKTFSLEELSW